MMSKISLTTTLQAKQLLAPQMIQSVQVLQLGHDDLQSFVADQLERNPFLEKAVTKKQNTQSAGTSTGVMNNLKGSDRFDDGQNRENSYKQTVSLQEHLCQQVMSSFYDKSEQRIALEIIYALETDGYLRRPLGEIIDSLEVDERVCENVLYKIQRFEPVGVAARDLVECLAIQLEDLQQLNEPMRILLKNLHNLSNFSKAKLAKLCGVSEAQIMVMAKIIKTLDPKPGHAFDQSPVMNAIPDVFFIKDEVQGLRVELNNEVLPRVMYNNVYASRITSGTHNEKDQQYINDCFQSAQYLIRSLEQRAKTILNVATHIALFQKDFLMKPDGFLRSLTMREMATEVGLHESTVSRTVANKYIMTARGLFAMKFFFSKSSVAGRENKEHSAHLIQSKIRKMIDAETIEAILSDDMIVQKLNEEGIRLARRTVAKYRDEMNIASSAKRRRKKREHRLS